MKFGKQLQFLTKDDWKKYYVDFDGLKKVIKRLKKEAEEDGRCFVSLWREVTKNRVIIVQKEPAAADQVAVEVSEDSEPQKEPAEETKGCLNDEEEQVFLCDYQLFSCLKLQRRD